MFECVHGSNMFFFTRASKEVTPLDTGELPNSDKEQEGRGEREDDKDEEDDDDEEQEMEVVEDSYLWESLKAIRVRFHNSLRRICGMPRHDNIVSQLIRGASDDRILFQQPHSALMAARRRDLLNLEIEGVQYSMRCDCKPASPANRHTHTLTLIFSL